MRRHSSHDCERAIDECGKRVVSRDQCTDSGGYGVPAYGAGGKSRRRKQWTARHIAVANVLAADKSRETGSKIRIGFVIGSNLVISGHCQRLGCDIGSGTGSGIKRVISGIGSSDGNAADADRFSRANVLVVEGGRRVAQGQNIACNTIIGKRHRGRHIAVIALIHSCRCHSQCLGRNIRSGAGSGIECVISGIGAGDGDAANADRFSRANVLVVEGGRRVAQGKNIACNAIIGKRHRGRRIAVIALVHSCRCHGQRLGRDIGGGAGSRIERVIPSIGAGDGDAADADRLGGARVLVVEGG